MNNNYSYQSEKTALKSQMDVLFKTAGEALVEQYLSDGFDGLALKLRLFNDFQRKLLFDFLIVEKKALLECIRRNKAFFLKMILDGKGEHLRPMLGLKSEKYDSIWLEALDLLNLYFLEKKVDEKLNNLILEKFFANSMLNTDKLRKNSSGNSSEI
ncbi:hypothetical protein IT411_01400 [Candidatus Peregrinibacteria bacterium]|nr:hypothetical protein [Candidatus Peregrinibacteria bacterium]